MTYDMTPIEWVASWIFIASIIVYPAVCGMMYDLKIPGVTHRMKGVFYTLMYAVSGVFFCTVCGMGMVREQFTDYVLGFILGLLWFGYMTMYFLRPTLRMDDSSKKG